MKNAEVRHLEVGVKKNLARRDLLQQPSARLGKKRAEAGKRENVKREGNASSRTPRYRFSPPRSCPGAPVFSFTVVY